MQSSQPSHEVDIDIISILQLKKLKSNLLKVTQLVQWQNRALNSCMPDSKVCNFHNTTLSPLRDELLRAYNGWGQCVRPCVYLI